MAIHSSMPVDPTIYQQQQRSDSPLSNISSNAPTEPLSPSTVGSGDEGDARAADSIQEQRRAASPASSLSDLGEDDSGEGWPMVDADQTNGNTHSTQGKFKTEANEDSLSDLSADSQEFPDSDIDIPLERLPATRIRRNQSLAETTPRESIAPKKRRAVASFGRKRTAPIRTNPRKRARLSVEVEEEESAAAEDRSATSQGNINRSSSQTSREPSQTVEHPAAESKAPSEASTPATPELENPETDEVMADVVKSPPKTNGRILSQSPKITNGRPLDQMYPLSPSKADKLSRSPARTRPRDLSPEPVDIPETVDDLNALLDFPTSFDDGRVPSTESETRPPSEHSEKIITDKAVIEQQDLYPTDTGEDDHNASHEGVLEDEAPDQVEADADAEIEASEAEEEQDEAEEEQDDATARERMRAMEALFKIEIDFARLRDRLYIERMEEVVRERATITRGTHAELIYLNHLIEERRTIKLRLAAASIAQLEAEEEREQQAEERACWSVWADSRATTKTDLLEQINQRRRLLEREKRVADRQRDDRLATILAGFGNRRGRQYQIAMLGTEISDSDLALEFRRQVVPREADQPLLGLDAHVVASDLELMGIVNGQIRRTLPV